MQTSTDSVQGTNLGTAVRVAVIGLGEGAEKIMLSGIAGLDDVTVVAGCDLNAETRERVATRWGIPQTYSDPAAMLAAEKPEIVVISSPPQTHFEMAKLVLNHDAHLYCEKPFMTSLQDADEIISLAEQKKRLVGVNSQYYQMPIYRRIAEELKEPASGRLFHIDAWQHMYLLPHEEGGWKAALQPRRVLLEFGTHVIDLICRYFEDYPLALTAQTAQVRPDVEADVCINVRLDFPGGRMANIMFNRMSYAPTRYFEMRLNCEKTALRASLGGVARLDLGWNSQRGRPRTRFSLTKGGEARLEKNGDSLLLGSQQDSAFGSAAGAHFARFAAAVRSGGEIDSDLSVTHARQILRVILTAYESVEQGGKLISL